MFNRLRIIFFLLSIGVASFMPADAQKKKQEWTPPKREKLRWTPPKTDAGDPVLDAWVPYTAADNWWIDLFGGVGQSFAENQKDHGTFSALGGFGGVAVGRQTSYLWSTRFAIEYAKQNGWVAEGKVWLPSVMGKGKYGYTTLELWLDERVSITNAFLPYDEWRKLNVQAFIGVGVNYGMGADKVTKMWEMINSQYALCRNTSLNLAFRVGAQAQYAVSQSMDLWAQLDYNMLGDKHNGLTHDGGGLEPCLDLAVGMSLYLPDHIFGGRRFRKLHHSQALQLRGSNEAVDKYFAREDARREEIIRNQKVEYGNVMDMRISFYIDRVFINDQQMENVRAVSQFMRQHPEVRIVVRAYSGVSRRCETQGLHLAKRRAEAVKQALAEGFGIDESRINLWYDESVRAPKPMRGEWIEAVEFEMVR